MTTVFFNGEALLRSSVLLPPMKWMKICRELKLSTENYTTTVFISGDEGMRDTLR